MSVDARVGYPGLQADGTFPERYRFGRSGGLISQPAHAAHYEAASRGNVYCAANSAAITFGTALTATGVTFHLSNPIGSKVDLVILKAACSIITCTTSGTILLASSYHPGTAPATNTSLVVVNARGGIGGNVGQAYSVSTLPVAPTAVMVLGSGVATIANAATNGATLDINGALVVRPGGQLSIQGLTIAGTGVCSMIWEEVPIE